MKLRTRLAALTIGATAAVAPLVAMPATSAAPSATEAPAASVESGEEAWYQGYFTGPNARYLCWEAGVLGWAAGLWKADWYCWRVTDTFYELYVNPYIIA